MEKQFRPERRLWITYVILKCMFLTAHAERWVRVHNYIYFTFYWHARMRRKMICRHELMHRFCLYNLYIRVRITIYITFVHFSLMVANLLLNFKPRSGVKRIGSDFCIWTWKNSKVKIRIKLLSIRIPCCKLRKLPALLENSSSALETLILDSSMDPHIRRALEQNTVDVQTDEIIRMESHLPGKKEGNLYI